MASALVKMTGRRPDRPQSVPIEVYASLVDALYEIALSLFIGSAAATLAALITAWKATSLVLLVFAVLIAAVTLARVLDMRAYKKARPTLRSIAAIRYWERRYVIGSAIYVGLLGLWCLACFMVTDDPFTRLFSFSVVLAYLIGTSGRNFASGALVVSQIVGGGIPLTLSLLYAGGLYYTIFGIVLLPFFASLKLISDRLRRQLLDAVITARDITQLAARFTTALNNMPHGLVMFDSEGKLLVANERFVELLHLPADGLLAGRTARDLLLAGSVFQGVPDADRFVADFEKSLAREPGELTAEIKDDRWLAFTSKPMENGGAVVIVEDVTDRRSAEQRIHRMARYDGLTGLPNRNSLHERLERALASAGPNAQLAILFVDLDEFKQVNDTLGHPAGDALLCSVADRLRSLISPLDSVARFGGDEFVVLQDLHGRADKDSEDLARRILQALAVPYQVEGHDIIIGASVGIAFAPRDGTDADLLLKNADMALYHAKANGRGAWRAFDSSMDEKAQARRALEMDLRAALAENQLELYYQPLINLRTMKIQTCEALLRWRHPQRGMVSPAEFIPVAEDMGIIKEIGDWVIRQACLECARWPLEVGVAVNLSSVQFRNPRLTAVIAEALRTAGLDASRLEVEITESVLLKDTPTVRAMLQELVAAGVRISLDDFGTGYSGLSYLHTFPLNKVKIDRSFVAQLHSGDRSLTLLRGVARLSAALGLSVAVEGIETNEQLDIIASEAAVDEAQGYLFSMPLPSAQIRDLIASQAEPSKRLRGRPLKGQIEAA